MILGTFPFPVFVALGIALLMYIVRWYDSREQVIKRTLKKTPLTEMKDVQEGTYVRIRGEVRAVREVIKAPLTARTCVYYVVRVRKKIVGVRKKVTLFSSRDAVGLEWSTIIEDETMADVVITDGEYYAVLECDQPRAYLVNDGNVYSGFMNDAPPIVENYLKKYKQNSKTILATNASMEYYEGILEEGEFCTVKGHAYWVDAKQLKMKLPVEKVLVIREKPGQPLYFSDDPDLEELN